VSAVGNVSNERIYELTGQISQLVLKTEDEEPRKLFAELWGLAKRGDRPNKAAKYAGYAAGIVAFVIMDSQPDTWFHNDAVILATILAVVAALSVNVLIEVLDGAIVRHRLNDWARRADLVVRAHGDAASNSVPIGTSAAAPKLKARPAPLTQSQKIIYSAAGVLGLISFGVGLDMHVATLVGIGFGLILWAFTSLFHRPDR
jgi:hypothetical protein